MDLLVAYFLIKWLWSTSVDWTNTINLVNHLGDPQVLRTPLLYFWNNLHLHNPTEDTAQGCFLYVLYISYFILFNDLLFKQCSEKGKGLLIRASSLLTCLSACQTGLIVVCRETWDKVKQTQTDTAILFF